MSLLSAPSSFSTACLCQLELLDAKKEHPPLKQTEALTEEAGLNGTSPVRGNVLISTQSEVVGQENELGKVDSGLSTVDNPKVTFTSEALAIR